jgi:hypothetical protein
MPSKKNIGLAQFCKFVRATIISTSKLGRRYILSFGIHELFHLITNTNSKTIGEEKILYVANKESVDVHTADVMVIWQLFSRSSSCSICTFCSTTRDS